MFGNNYIPGIKTATGSLGHGIGFATGMAFISKFLNKIEKESYVIISEVNYMRVQHGKHYFIIAS